jgi:hypothetical protein
MTYLALPDAYDLQGLQLAVQPRVTLAELAQELSDTDGIRSAVRLADGGVAVDFGYAFGVIPAGAADLWAASLIAHAAGATPDYAARKAA